jgi:hypothetical protein
MVSEVPATALVVTLAGVKLRAGLAAGVVVPPPLLPPPPPPPQPVNRAAIKKGTAAVAGLSLSMTESLWCAANKLQLNLLAIVACPQLSVKHDAN